MSILPHAIQVIGTAGEGKPPYPTGTFTVKQYGDGETGNSVTILASESLSGAGTAQSSALITTRTTRTANGATITFTPSGNNRTSNQYRQASDGTQVSFPSPSTTITGWSYAGGSSTITAVRYDVNGATGNWLPITGVGLDASIVRGSSASYSGSGGDGSSSDSDSDFIEIYLRSNEYADTKVAEFQFYTQAYAAANCFIKSSRVLVWDEESSTYVEHPISHVYNLVEVGHSVIVQGSDGVRNTVVEARAVWQPQTIYGFNGSDNFVTGGHPFLTTTGWKCMDAENGRALHPELNITQLEVGDTLVRFDKDTGQYTEEALSIITEEATEQTVYSLDVSGDNTPDIEGNDTYIVNGYVVHNK
jgi:hypothetical protein